MNEVKEFLIKYNKKAIDLSNAFKKTRKKEWTPLIILNELSVQIGHIYNVEYKSIVVNEPGRDFNNLGDELSDVFLQLIALADMLNIKMLDIVKMEEINESSWRSLPILFGQLNEAVMEKYGYRFTKPRDTFETLDDFIKDRIFRLFFISYNIAIRNNLNIEEEFEKMLEDASGFLAKFNRG